MVTKRVKGLEEAVQSLGIVTPVLPARSAHLGDAGRCVDEIRAKSAQIGWRVTWHVAVDGPGEIPAISPDHMIRNSGRRGIPASRNAVLATVDAEWATPLDADDLFDTDGVLAILTGLSRASKEVGWISANRLLVTGERTPHWRATPRGWVAGELAENWVAPFPFHPNSIIARTELIWECGGWPAIGTNEDMALCLLMSERKPGLSLVDVLTYYRAWDKQEVASDAYVEDKLVSFAAIERIINAVRRTHGRGPVRHPAPGVAYGAVAEVPSTAT